MLIYLALMTGAVLFSPERSELGKLKPVETVRIYIEQEEVVLETDTGDMGRGATAEDALMNMKNTASGIIYLDTADYLLIRKGAESQVSELQSILKETVQLCYAQSAVDITQAASYLSVHKPDIRLKEWGEHTQLPTLCAEGDRMILLREKR